MVWGFLGVGLSLLIPLKGTLNGSACQEILDYFMLLKIWEQFGDGPSLGLHRRVKAENGMSLKYVGNACEASQANTQILWQYSVSQKVGTVPCMPLCSFPLSLSVIVWEVRRPIARVLREECYPILVWCRILTIHLSWVFNARFYGLQAGQFNTWTLLLQRQAVVKDAVCGLLPEFCPP